LNSKLFANTMASYSTSYGSSTANRASNVARAASLINGKVLAPGEVFSFNSTVGKRTVANGFSTAPEYVNGKTVDGIGGGTCQVSSTLYNAVLYSDLDIVSRTNHMFTVSYVPNGQDATVADGGPDFKFKNNTDYPIKISAYTGGGKITVSIIGTDWEPKREVKINNSTSYSSNGDTLVRTTRTVYANGEVINTETLPSSTYKQHKTE
ncbi:MAG: VanW family protein, partial [Clostridia bacterium]